MDLISVIIPVWQVEQYLKECVDSVLAQTYSNLELILVDDGSTDASGIICDDYAKKDIRVRVIHQKNAGSASARNAGLKEAKGKYVCFVDSDDILSSIFLEKLLQMVQRNGVDIAVCYFSKHEYDLKNNTGGKDELEVISGKCMLKQWHGKRKSVETVVWNKLYERKIFERLGFNIFPDGKLHEDIYVSHLFINEADKIAITREKLYFYRKRSDSISRNISTENMIQDLCAQKVRMKFFKDNNFYCAYLRLLLGHLLHRAKYFCSRIYEGING